MNKRYNIVIVGAGITGLTVAALLARNQHRDRIHLTIVDAAPRTVHQSGEDVALRVSAISTGSAELLSSFGAWQSVVETRACAYDRMRVWDESGLPESSSTLRFDAEEFAVRQLGFIVENSLVQHAILDVLDRESIELIFEAPIRKLHRDGQNTSLELEDGRTRDADLVIGADGARSFIRDSVEIGTQEWRYGQSAVVTHLHPEKPHRNTAWQRFLRDGPLGMLPLSDGRISVVWSTGKDRAEQAMAADDAELGRMLSEASDRVLGELTVAGPRGAFPLCARHANKYVLSGLALIGDAAHAVHPLAGQGANLGLQDAAKLAETVAAALAQNEHPGDRPVLRRYERARKGDNAAMLHFMTGLNRLFTTDSVVLRELRTTGMRLFNRSGPIRKSAVKVALGV